MSKKKLTVAYIYIYTHVSIFGMKEGSQNVTVT